MYSTATSRLQHGHAIEDQFIEWMNSKSLWNTHEFGQKLYDMKLQKDLRRSGVCVKSDQARSLIELLPEAWQFKYRRGVGNEMPLLCRWDPDVLCVYNGKLQFFTEIKSTANKGDLVFIEMSCYLAALANKQRLCAPQLFIFSPIDDATSWTYLTLDQIPELCAFSSDGKGSRGSQTPYVAIEKLHLQQTVDELLEKYEQDWPL